MKDAKFCKDCKHFQRIKTLSKMHEVSQWCTFYISPVDGAVIWWDAIELRENPALCGIDGKHWEAKA